MSNFKIEFDNAWLFLLLIPAVAIALWPYFRLERKYRRTRNRIISLVLHLCIMFLCVTALTGVAFAFDSPIVENELIIVVDVSYSSQKTQDAKNDFIDKVLTNRDSSFKVGIVTFGNEAAYVAPLSMDTFKVNKEYLDSLSNLSPNGDSATNISKALLFAKDCFTNPKAGKILLLSDGLETDGSAMGVITSIIRDGIIIETVFFGNDYGTEVQVTGLIMPDYNVKKGDTVSLGIRYNSTFAGTVDVALYDNGKEDPVKSVDIESDINKVIWVDHVFTDLGPHQIHVVINSASDTTKQNNNFYSFVNLMTYDKLLILQKNDEATALIKLMDDETNYFNYESDVKVMQIADAPINIVELSKYDQVILINIANSDMPIGFIETLEYYVNVLGGGLLTVGGNKFNSNKPNVYTKAEMYETDGVNETPTLYQQMLPVECDDYTPPVAIMLALDRSGSMGFPSAVGSTVDMMTIAKEAVVAIARDDYLHPRDYLGLVAFASTATEIMGLQPLPDYNTVNKAVERLSPNGGTDWGVAIEKSLAGFDKNNVSRKHIVLVTDGEPDPEINQAWNTLYPQIIKCVQNKITLSIVTLGAGRQITEASKRVQNSFNNLWKDYYGEVGKGRVEIAASVSELKPTLKELFGSEGIKDTNEGNFKPIIGAYTQVVQNVREEDIPILGGFYGVKLKTEEGVVAPLMGEFTPIYAQWTYGKGRVGSFMCDLKGPGGWAGTFMSDKTGKQLLDNIINGLFPIEAVELSEIQATATRTNYTLQVAVESSFTTDESFEITVTDITLGNPESVPMTKTADTSGGRPKATFNLTQLGIYQIRVLKKDAKSGEILADEFIIYTVFSYSDEYDSFPTKDGSEYLSKLSNGNVFTIDKVDNNGSVIDNTDYSKAYLGIPNSYPDATNPRVFMIILILIMFLLDLAVRKFKFRWPWEMYRDHKAKMELKKNVR